MDSHYELIDFGSQRKLERFGNRLVARSCPVATHPPSIDDWNSVDSQFASGNWKHHRSLEEEWIVGFQNQRFELRATPSGQVGVFPEQAPNWEYIRKKLGSREAKVLNLFGYTGGSTIAAAMAGAEVVHVDSAKSVVGWARKNAELSGLADAPIRWIVEDAPKFVAREVKRGNRYDAIIMDPPSYGHGTKGEEWKLSRDLVDLLGDCKALLSDNPAFFLLSCHTPGFGAAELSATLTTCLFGSCAAGVKTRDLSLSTRDGRRLFAGHAAYWP